MSRGSKLGVFIVPGRRCDSTCTIVNAHCNSVSAGFGHDSHRSFIAIPRKVTRFLRRGLFRDRRLSTFAQCTRANTSTGTCASFSGAYCLFRYASEFRSDLHVLLSFIARPCFAGRAIRGRRNVVKRRVAVCCSIPN